MIVRNNRLAIVEIEAAIPSFRDKAFGSFLLEQFQALDGNSDGEIELNELAECCRRWRKQGYKKKIQRDKQSGAEGKLAAPDKASDRRNTTPDRRGNVAARAAANPARRFKDVS